MTLVIWKDQGKRETKRARNRADDKLQRGRQICILVGSCGGPVLFTMVNLPSRVLLIATKALAVMLRQHQRPFKFVSRKRHHDRSPAKC